MAIAQSRARPLSPDDRRQAIIEAVIPLILEHGVGITSRQIAEAAGVAEGTVFRAFSDKDSLIDAAADAFLTRAAVSAAGPIVDPALPLDEKLALVMDVMSHRVRDVMRMAMLTGRHGPAPTPAQMAKFNAMIADTFAPDAAQLRVPLERLGQFMRALAIATSIPTGGTELSPAEIVELISHGVVAPTSDAPSKKE